MNLAAGWLTQFKNPPILNYVSPIGVILLTYGLDSNWATIGKDKHFSPLHQLHIHISK
jgi:hypothetical protein